MLPNLGLETVNHVHTEDITQWINRFEGWDQKTSYGHVIRSSCHCIAKSHQRLGWQPCWSSLEAVYESLQALLANGKVVDSYSGLDIKKT